MDIRITPSFLSGKVEVPASKSCAHRALICASLAHGTSVISGVNMSKDIEATINAMTALGAHFKVDGSMLTVTGIESCPQKAEIDCCESGSTLRFVIPVAAALGVESTFAGKGRLPQRPIDIFKRELSKNGVRFISSEMPYVISGKLIGGRYEIEGDISSQFVTGLIFALPLLEENSEIVLTSHLESRPYVDITIDILRRYGISINENKNGFLIKGGQRYTPHDEKIEGDFSQAAFFYVANALGADIDLGNLNENSVQGDRKILEILGHVCHDGHIGSFRADCSDIPDLVPILTVLGAFGSDESVIYNAKRLKIKESNRLETSAALVNSLGGNAEITDDGLIIHPTGKMHGGEVNSFGDHRIVMAAAVAAAAVDGDVTIRGAEAAEKSYPDFFKDYIQLGGKVNVINLE